jgi:hypothetical protein
MISIFFRNGAFCAARANLLENSPKDKNWAFSFMRPNMAASQKAVAPPFPITTS